MRVCDDILPIEIWDLVIQELDSQPEFLLILATVCRAFNDLAIARYLLCVGVSAESMAAGSIEIDGNHLPSLLLSRCTPPISKIACSLADEGLLRNLKLARKIITNLPDLREISLAFSRELLKAHPNTSLKLLTTALCHVMHTMSLRTAGPVFIISGGAVFRCASQDILHWQLHDTEEKSSLSMATRFLGRSVRVPAYAIIRDQSDQPIKIKLISSICSVSMRSIPLPTGPYLACTFVVFNRELEDTLHLGRAATSLASHSISSPELTPILPYVTLPALIRVHLNTTTIDPAELSEFLLRHPSVTFLAYEPPDTDFRPLVLLSPPISHPALVHIRVTDSVHVVALLDSIGHSPTLSEIGFHYMRDSPTTVSALASALGRIALQPRDTTLILRLSSSPGPRRALDAAECALAESLTCVVRIAVDCTSVADARALLPWLDKLPSLRRVEFHSARGIFKWGGGRRDPQEQTMRFLEDAMAGLPRVAEVIVREVPIVVGQG
jgi:hypothetical protein